MIKNDERKPKILIKIESFENSFEHGINIKFSKIKKSEKMVSHFLQTFLIRSKLLLPRRL